MEALADGTGRDAGSISAQYPEAPELIATWIRDAARAEHWSRVDKFANLAAPMRAPGLGEVLQELLDSEVDGFNKEDVVDILGEIQAEAAVGSLFRVAARSVVRDAPAYWLCQKVISSLGGINTIEAREVLRQMTATSWPPTIRWYAAVELGIEDELGFDEDEMLR
ncbi:hypothetical protein [Streptomyces sp. NPDC003660]